MPPSSGAALRRELLGAGDGVWSRAQTWSVIRFERILAIASASIDIHPQASMEIFKTDVRKRWVREDRLNLSVIDIDEYR